MLIVDRRGRAGEIVDLVDLDVERKGYVMTQHLEPSISKQRLDVAMRPREIVVDAENLAFLVEQSSAQVRAQEARAARHKNPLFHCASPIAAATRQDHLLSEADHASMHLRMMIDTTTIDNCS
jgi:hypothetical protein